jgi:hypothetical protein
MIRDTIDIPRFHKYDNDKLVITQAFQDRMKLHRVALITQNLVILSEVSEAN